MSRAIKRYVPSRWAKRRATSPRSAELYCTCIYCAVKFWPPLVTHGRKPSWKHFINDARIVTRDNIARCCVACNSSKEVKDLAVWLESKYCKRRGITQHSVASVVR